MKKIFVALFITILTLTLTACGDAGLGVKPTEKLLDPVRVYEVDAWGSNPDIYEFTPVGHEHMTCLILVSGGDTAGGMECFPKEQPNK